MCRRLAEGNGTEYPLIVHRAFIYLPPSNPGVLRHCQHRPSRPLGRQLRRPRAGGTHLGTRFGDRTRCSGDNRPRRDRRVEARGGDCRRVRADRHPRRRGVDRARPPARGRRRTHAAATTPPTTRRSHGSTSTAASRSFPIPSSDRATASASGTFPFRRRTRGEAPERRERRGSATVEVADANSAVPEVPAVPEVDAIEVFNAWLFTGTATAARDGLRPNTTIRESRRATHTT